jgi:hypothetical protein
MRCGELAAGTIDALLARYAVRAEPVAAGCVITGSYWGESEAGLVDDALYFRADTPVHSLLHELAHFVCMDRGRRDVLDTDAGGDDAEECAVCYLEVLLADHLAPFDAERCLADMDAWGYSFREGSASAWFRGDGRDARSWLLERGLIDADERPSWRRRD